MNFYTKKSYLAITISEITILMLAVCFTLISIIPAINAKERPEQQNYGKIHKTTTANKINPSETELKNIGEKFPYGIEKIKQINSYYYTLKTDKTKTPYVGVKTLELQKIFPDAVTKAPGGYLTVRQDEMFYAMINAIKQLDTNSQKNIKEINRLKAKNKELELRLQKLEKLSQVKH